MSLTRNRGAVLKITAALALAATAATATAATLVVRASGPAAKSYPAGRAVAGTLKLGPTDMVTVLDAKGTRTFRGPGSFDVASTSTNASAGTTLAALVSQPGQRRARIGAVRGTGGAPRSPNIWYVDATHAGPHCVSDTSTVTLWRPAMDSEATTTITGGGRTETVSWLKGQSAKPWPAGLPVSSGAEYKLSGAGMTPASVRFVVLPKGDEGLDTIAGKLISNNCKAQLDLLVDAAAASADAAPQG